MSKTQILKRLATPNRKVLFTSTSFELLLLSIILINSEVHWLWAFLWIILFYYNLKISTSKVIGYQERFALHLLIFPYLFCLLIFSNVCITQFLLNNGEWLSQSFIFTKLKLTLQVYLPIYVFRILGTLLSVFWSLITHSSAQVKK